MSIVHFTLDLNQLIEPFWRIWDLLHSLLSQLDSIETYSYRGKFAEFDPKHGYRSLVLGQMMCHVRAMYCSLRLLNHHLCTHW